MGLTRRGRMDHLTVRAEARPDATPDERAAAAGSLARAVKDSVGVSVTVDIIDPDTRERSVGKLRRFVESREQ
ncbi:hypothetical protein [Streptomyces sp. ZAF1911]|uniref:hypothetical protein n=1 Tax=Streptomyces sp. ZAF1911 TaxID=2944129 RepID=UPI003FCF897F